MLDENNRIDKGLLQEWEQPFPSMSKEMKFNFFTRNMELGRRFSKYLLYHVWMYNDDDARGIFWDIANKYIHPEHKTFLNIDMVIIEQTLEDIIDVFNNLSMDKKKEISSDNSLKEYIYLFSWYPSPDQYAVQSCLSSIKSDIITLRKTEDRNYPLLIGTMKSHIGDRLLERFFHEGKRPIFAQLFPC